MPHKFGINSPLSVKYISQKAFFKHALDPEDYYLEDYEKIWEILKQYDYAKDKSAQGDCKAAIGE